MKAVIMAGGFGTRLRPLTMNIPKPMVPVMNKPMMEHIVELLKDHNITDLIVLLYFQPEKITDYFGDGSKFGVRMQYINAEEDYGTAGSVRNAYKFLDERFIIISGDVLTDFDLTKAIKYHEGKKSLATIVLTQVKNPLAFGVVITAEDGKITRFLEKPSWGEVFSDTINTGIYILEPEVLESIPYKKEFDFSKDLFPLMLKNKQALYGYIAEGYWKDIGSLDEYRESHFDCLMGDVNVKIAGEKNAKASDGSNVWIGEGTTIADSVKFDGPCVIGKNCKIGDNVYINNAVISDNCSIGTHSHIRNSILWDRIYLDEEVRINGSVVCSNTRIGNNATVEENVFISEDCQIGNYSLIKPNVKIWPQKRIEEGAVLSTSLIWGDKWLRELFTESRISGLANTEISPEFGAKLGAAFGAFLGHGSIVLTSRDSSNAGRMINRAIICGLMSAGVNVHDIGALPIPIVRHELRSGKAKGGVHTRQSPFDGRSLDIIFFDTRGKDLPAGKTKSVERLFFREDFKRASFDQIGKLDFPVRVTEAYRENFLKALDVDAIESGKFKVVIDYSHGGASTVFPGILGSLNCEFISLNAYLDSKRLTRDRETFEQSIKQLSTIVTSLKADVGFLIDAGAEKIFIVDEDGNFWNDVLLTMVVTKLYLETHKPNKIAIPISAPVEIDQMSRHKNVPVIHTKNDHGSMMNASLDGADYIAGTRGGFIFSNFSFACDGMFAVAKILELLAKTGSRFGQIAKTMIFPTILQKNVPCPWESKGKVMRHLMKFSENMQHELVDGVKIYFGDASALLVPDKEQAFFQIIVESKDKSKAEDLMSDMEKKVGEWVSK
jgi:mannose-1-phosphate guanylyltransferase/phosphomannomutase